LKIILSTYHQLVSAFIRRVLEVIEDSILTENNDQEPLTEHAADAPDEHQIVERIYTAVMEQRLAPGTKLSEPKLCEAFGVGRLRVRRALLLLANQGIVELHSNRGGFVAQPDQQEARDVFGARLALEPGIVRQVAARIEGTDNADLQPLQQHIELEQQAQRQRNRRDLIRLSGEFHVKLAAATGNRVLTRIVRELVTRTSLIIGLFGMSGVSSCEEHEHLEILNALRRHDAERADALIRAHLATIEADLNLSVHETGQSDLVEILSRP
jgi:DNA-binding GntR family transcriptional regulator